jgi:hypothetical protein
MGWQVPPQLQASAHPRELSPGLAGELTSTGPALGRAARDPWRVVACATPHIIGIGRRPVKLCPVRVGHVAVARERNLPDGHVVPELSARTPLAQLQAGLDQRSQPVDHVLHLAR